LTRAAAASAPAKGQFFLPIPLLFRTGGSGGGGNNKESRQREKIEKKSPKKWKLHPRTFATAQRIKNFSFLPVGVVE
jgi:hypothetical protein